MDTLEVEKLKFPVGKMPMESKFTQEEILNNIKTIEEFPANIRKAVKDLTDEQLDTPYRPGGWTPRILVHHVGDSHMNAFMRCKLALTEDSPTIKPYFEDRWAELADYKNTPVEISLVLLDNLHKRWVILLNSLTSADMKKDFIHPEHNTKFSVEQVINLYAWHSRHHLAHITNLKERMGW